MKKFLLSFSVIAVFVLYSFHQKEEEASVAVIPPQSLQNSSSSTSPTNNSFPNTTGTTPSPSATPLNPQSAYKDGTYTGDVADAFYGNVQVQVTIQNGKITDVTFLQYPNDRGTSIEINSQAMPYLKAEAIQAQNAQVDIVTGATQTSGAFRESLQSALDKARG